MKQSQAMDRPLSEAELDQLAEDLAALGPGAMTLEGLDGYFAALHCSPELLMPNVYLEPVLGRGEGFADPAQAGKVIGLVMRHWNTVGHNLEQSLKRKDIHVPLLQADADGVAQANDWAQGFLQAVSLSQHLWNEIILDKDRFGMILPVMTLAHEHDPDPGLRPDPISVEQRERLIELMAVGLIQMYRYFEPHRRASAIPVSGGAPRRSEPKVGRNDPCPCGSGKKFKRCCGGPSASTLH